MRPDAKKILLAVVAVLVAIVILFVALGALFPAEDPRFVGIPTIYPYANDPDGIIGLGSVYAIDEVCGLIDQETTCEVAFLVVNSTLPNDIDYYALRTFQKNGIGEEGKDNGVLVVVAYGDGHWRIEVGYGLMGILTSQLITALGDEYISSNLTDPTYLGFGLEDLAWEIGIILEEEYADTGGGVVYPVEGIPLELWQWVLIVIVVIVLGVVTRGRAFIWIFYILQGISGGKGGFGGGRSGGGGGSR